MRYYRSTTVYLERAMHQHFAKACDMSRTPESREHHRMIGAQLEAVVERDAERARWHGIRHHTAT